MLEANEGVFAWGLQSGWSRMYRWWCSGKFVVSAVEQDERAGRAGRRGSHVCAGCSRVVRTTGQCSRDPLFELCEHREWYGLSATTRPVAVQAPNPL